MSYNWTSASTPQGRERLKELADNGICVFAKVHGREGVFYNVLAKVPNPFGRDELYSFLMRLNCASKPFGWYIENDIEFLDPSPQPQQPDENGLLPCPFCGEAGKLEGLSKISDFGCDANSKDAHKWFPRCSNSDCLVYNAEAQDEQGGVYVDFPTKEKAIEAWNKRA